MTVSSTTNRVNYTAIAGQVNFDYTFPVFEDTHMKVYSGGVLKTLNVDYTIVLELKRGTFVYPPGAGVSSRGAPGCTAVTGRSSGSGRPARRAGSSRSA